MTSKTTLAVALLICFGCASDTTQSVSPGPVVGRTPGYVIREFKFDNNVRCYTNGPSISCLQLKVQ